MKFGKIALFLILLAGLFTNVAFAAFYEVFFDDMIVQFDSGTSQIKVENFNIGQNVQSGASLVSFGGIHIRNAFQVGNFSQANVHLGSLSNGFISEGGVNINGRHLTRRLLEERAQQQQSFIEENTCKYTLSELSSVLKAEHDRTKKLLLLVANIDPRSGRYLDFDTFRTLVSAFENPNEISVFIFERGDFSSLGEVAQTVQDLATRSLSDTVLAKALNVVGRKYPSLNLAHKLALYRSIRSDSYRIDGINALNLAGMSTAEALDLVRGVSADTYKIDAIKVLVTNHLNLTCSEALSLIDRVQTSTYKVDAIKVLSSYLSSITNDEYFRILHSLSPSYKEDAMRWLPQPTTQSLNREPVGKAGPLSPASSSAPSQNRVSNLVSILKEMDWDSGKANVLRSNPITEISAEEAALLLKCFDWDEGKLQALQIILSNASKDSRLAIKQNQKVILRTFDWDSGKTQALSLFIL